MTTLTLYNTKTRTKEAFAPLDPDNVRMYVCGPTVYDRAHLGNARPVIVFDVLYRLLRHVYGEDQVTYVRNFTDVDDKINATAAARKAGGATGTMEELIAERSDETIVWYHADMDALGNLRPDHAPRATEYIAEMQAMITELIDRGFAYAVQTTEGHNSGAQYVYLDSERVPQHAFLSVEAFEDHAELPAYGSLSGRSVDDMIAGSRAETGEGKRNPMDSVLWKPSTVDQPGWESDWGFGRPGWHIECSAMARKLLGKQFDIHGGGLDLMFPHHENELAQCRACDGADASARYWMHNEMLQVEGKKMSKSLGNFFTVRDLLDQGVPGEVIRFVMLSTHYRKPMDWTEKKRQEAEEKLRRYHEVVAKYRDRSLDGTYSPSDQMIAALASDLNTHSALSYFDEFSKLTQEAMQSKTDYANQLYADLEFLGLLDQEEANFNWSSWIDPNADKLSEIATYLENLRDEAKQTGNFDRIDALKSKLLDAGVEVKMFKDGVKIEVDWFAAYSQMLREKNDGRFCRVTGVDREETARWIASKMNSPK